MASLVFLKSMLLTKALQRNQQNKPPTKIFKQESKCRICYQDEADIPIFDGLSELHLAEEIYNFSNVSITNSDKYPKYMCHSCLELLNGCILFRNLCQKTDKLLTGASKVIWKAEHYSDSNDDFGNDVNNSINFHDDLNVAEDLLISDDSYSVPSPTFSDNHGVSCNSCQRYFSDSESYDRHLWYSEICKGCTNQPRKVNISKSRPKALCEICGKTVSRPAILGHKRLHQNIFPYACDSCPYRGRNKNLLVVHLRSHMVIKPYKCTICSKTMISKSNLSKHMRAMHCDIKTFTCECPECGRSFRTAQNMREHITNVHNNQTRVECDICFKSFRTGNLKDHRRKVHNLVTPKTGRPSNRLPSYIKCMMEEDSFNEQDELATEMSLQNVEVEYPHV